jgi:stalled ribosome rescue protein Dom34
MAAHVGLWIDHRKTVIVTVSDHGEATRLVTAEVGKHVRFSGGAGSGESHRSQKGTGEGTRERRFEGQLSTYYDEVIACIRDADAILIFGPGEAKGELRAKLERGGLGARIIAVETVDKMTDRQIAAKVRERLAL